MATVLISKEKMWRLAGEIRDITTEESQSVKADQVGVVQTRKDGLGELRNFTLSFKSQA